jgi:ribosomal protein S18 acetylase RimI-like enzyme
MSFHLQPSEPADEAFLWLLNQLAYQEVVTAQFGAWDRTKQRAFFDNKWRTQTYLIIVRDALPVGAVSRTLADGALTLMELLVLPAHQNAGIGTRVIRQLQAEASALQLPLLLQVLHANRARRLYERLGFRVYETTETHYRMRWDGDARAAECEPMADA